uniref:Uncharacterized protein n=1 Tax=Arundo donax TaxID=35708 RepID=A0A0A9ADX9_ARUDO
MGLGVLGPGTAPLQRLVALRGKGLVAILCGTTQERWAVWCSSLFVS